VNVGVLLLAAGQSGRFGSDKRVARLPGGDTLLDATIAAVRDAGLPLLVCLRPDDDALAAQLRARGVDCVPCARAGEGMGGTLAEGVAHVRHWDGVLVALADMPWVRPATYRGVAAMLALAAIAVPVQGRRRGHPVGFRAELFAELAALGGDAGARRVLERHARQVFEAAVDDPGIHRDVDRATDLPPTPLPSSGPERD